jgi:L-fucose dehydrogenase
MDLEIKNKVMIVTGGASGIGAAITRRLAIEEAIPVVIDKNEEAGKKLIKELHANDQKAILIIRNLDSSESCKSAAKQAVDETGRIDGLFNNAGINDAVGLEKGTSDQFLQSLSRNLYHYYYMTQACLPELKRNQGVIINTASKTAITGQGNTSGYSASKGAQLALTREWAVELLKYGIRVNAIVPAEVMTPLYKNWLENSFSDPVKQKKSIERKIPLGHRFTTPEEIADMAVYLASGRAGHITGQHIHVDGGYVHLDRAVDP